MKRICKKLLIIWLIIFNLELLPACNNYYEDDMINEIDLIDDIVENYTYIESDELPNEISVVMHEIEIPYGYEVSSFYIYNSIVYYVISNCIYVSMSDEYSEYINEIRCFNTETHADDSMFSYKSSDYNYVSDIKCNGNYLVFIQTNQTQSLICMDLRKDLEPMYICTGDDFSNNGLFEVTSEGVYWLKEASDYVNEKCLWSFYNFETSDTTVEERDDTIYNSFTVLDDTYISSEFLNEEKIKNLYINNLQSKYKTCLRIKASFSPILALANNRLCIWNDFYSNLDLFVYDQKLKTLENLKMSEGDSFALHENTVFIGNDNEITCYDIETKQKNSIEFTDIHMFDLIQGKTDNIYVQYMEEEDFIEYMNSMSLSSVTEQTYENDLYIIELKRR